MRVVIIEDEKLTAEDLAGSIVAACPAADIIAVLQSVQEAVTFFKTDGSADIIFSDIQLGDGLSFKIFDAVNITVPVIFCTAYNEYALDAFKTAGIDYILKPFTVQSIKAAVEKYNTLKQNFTKNIVSYEAFGRQLANAGRQQQQALLVYYKDKILPVKIEDIAVLFLKNDAVHLATFDKQQYYINEALDEVEKIAGDIMFRVNRQYLVNKKTVKDVSKYFGRKLLLNLTIPFPEKITVSKLRTPQFLQWLSGSQPEK